jgi:hypothetical protein
MLNDEIYHGETFDVFEPWMLMVGEHRALVVTRWCTTEFGYNMVIAWRTFMIAHIKGLTYTSSVSAPLRKRWLPQIHFSTGA